MGDGVTIKKIHIANLFDMYDYDIDFNYDDNISYLIAPNGFGKTTILKMIDFIYRPFLYKNADLLGIPFNSVDCELTDGKHMGITRRKVGEGDEQREKSYKYSSLPVGAAIDRVLYAEERLFLNYNGNEIDSTVILEESLQSLRLRFNENSDQEYRTHSDEKREKERFLYPLNQRIKQKIEEKLKEFDCENEIIFIKADRIYEREPVFGNYEERRILSTYADPVAGMRERIRRKLRDMSIKYGDNLDLARNQFLNGIFEDDGKAMNFEEFDAKWNEYKEKYECFAEIGITDVKNGGEFLEQDISKQKYAKKARELSTYIKAFSPTFDSLKDDYDKLKLLMEIFNTRNRETGKKLIYKRERVYCVLKNGSGLSLDKLSSGEKNDLMMFFKLIFDTIPNGIVLIDEPEISLNINWQEDFGYYLQRICEKNGMHAIIATHSPHIINGRVAAITKIKGSIVAGAPEEASDNTDEIIDEEYEDI